MLIYHCRGRERGCCDHEAPIPWTGPCPRCHRVYNCVPSGHESTGPSNNSLAALAVKDIPRITTGSKEVDAVLGGGLVSGASYLISGGPGEGKSTFLIWLSGQFASEQKTVIYASAEETADDVGQMAKRVCALSPHIQVLGDEGDAYKIGNIVEEKRPTLLIVDSLHTMQCSDSKGSEGSGAQVSAVTQYFTALGKRLGKKKNFCVMLICHVNKEGELAGPKTIEHLVDVVLEWDPVNPADDYDDEEDAKKHVDDYEYMRELSVGKNRKGASGESARFMMPGKDEVGPVSPVKKKSRLYSA